MFAPDRETFQSLHALDRHVRENGRPLVIWVGAGVSAWAGYPLWIPLASQMHSQFSREERNYNAPSATAMLKEGLLPDLFEQMRIANEQHYFRTLVATFSPRSHGAVYTRFLKSLAAIAPLQIVTTNIDEMIERHVSNATLIQRSNLEQTIGHLHRREPFICKLHGSISSVTSAVFSKRDYETLVQDDAYLRLVGTIFSESTVLFLGYGLGDEYVLKSLLAAEGERPLFGTGPHFIVTPSELKSLPLVVNRIQYVPEMEDHRDSLQVLELLVGAANTSPQSLISPSSPSNVLEKKKRSVYLISNILPLGTWETSQTLEAESKGGKKVQMIIGEGFIDGEVHTGNYSALHDIAVGLLCFDLVYFPLDAMVKVHSLLGSEIFWHLVNSDAMGFIHAPHHPAMIFDNPEVVTGGTIGTVTQGSAESNHTIVAEMGVSELIRRSLKAVAGKEDEANRMISNFAERVVVLPQSGDGADLAACIRSSLVHPSIRRLLGISGGTSALAIPRWVAYPVLRLARVIAIGEMCKHIEATSIRLIFGSERLASAAFSASASQVWADDAASYVLAGRFNADLGALLASDPGALARILTFRGSQIGEDFRKEVASLIEANEGSSVVAAINSGLQRALPTALLEKVRDQVSGLLVPRYKLPTLTPSVWGDLHNGDLRIRNWRKRSRQLLDEACQRLKIQPYDMCPCGSGEKLKFCCQEALRQ